MSEVGVEIGAPGNQRRGALCAPQFESLLVQAPHQRLAHARHAQHTEAPAFQLVQDYPRGVVDIVLLAVNGRRGSVRGCVVRDAGDSASLWFAGVSPAECEFLGPSPAEHFCALFPLFLSTA